MSKATFYEHFGNKEDCIVALFDAATEIVLDAMRDAAARDHAADPEARVRTTLGAFLGDARALPRRVADAAGGDRRRRAARDGAPRPRARGGRPVPGRAQREDAARGATPRFASPDDAFAIVGAVVELASRQIRTGVPGDIRELEPVVERLSLGLMAAGANERHSRRSSARSSSAAAARGWWRGASRSRPRSGRRSATGTTGAGRSRVRRSGRAGGAAGPGARRPRRQPHGPHVHRRPLGRLPVRRPARDRLREPADSVRGGTGWRCATASSPRPCAARRRPTSRCRPSATTARTGSSASWRCSARARARLPRPVRLEHRRARARGRGSATAPRRATARYAVLGCFHPSQQNTFTGKLTAPMMEAVLRRARELAG